MKAVIVRTLPDAIMILKRPDLCNLTTEYIRSQPISVSLGKSNCSPSPSPFKSLSSLSPALVVRTQSYTNQVGGSFVVYVLPINGDTGAGCWQDRLCALRARSQGCEMPRPRQQRYALYILGALLQVLSCLPLFRRCQSLVRTAYNDA